MNFRKLTLAFVSLALLAMGAQAAPSAKVLAELRVSGGFAAPSFYNTSALQILKSGEVVQVTYESTGPLTPAFKEVITPVAKLPVAKLKTLQAKIAKIEAGTLVDEDPNGPHGADFPNLSYSVFKHGQKIVIVSRGGDAHTDVLQQDGVYEIRELLDALSSVANF